MDKGGKKYQMNFSQNNKEKDINDLKVNEKRSNHILYVSKYEKPNSKKELNNKESTNYYSTKTTRYIPKQNFSHNSQEEKEQKD